MCNSKYKDMKLSKLQKYILKTSFLDSRLKIPRTIFIKFYGKRKKPNKDIRTKIISKSIERLIDKGVIIGFGEKTQFKLYIRQIKLTKKGKNISRKLLGEQTKISFKK